MWGYGQNLLKDKIDAFFIHVSRPQEWGSKVVNIKLAMRNKGLDHKINVPAICVKVMRNL